jgi:hypothetical protein
MVIEVSYSRIFRESDQIPRSQHGGEKLKSMGVDFDEKSISINPARMMTPTACARAGNPISEF